MYRCLTRWDVMAYGVGSTVGAGIFVTTYTGAQHAGPIGVVMSFIVASVACMFSAFSYAEFSGMIDPSHCHVLSISPRPSVSVSQRVLWCLWWWWWWWWCWC